MISSSNSLFSKVKQWIGADRPAPTPRPIAGLVDDRSPLQGLSVDAGPSSVDSKRALLAPELYTKLTALKSSATSNLDSGNLNAALKTGLVVSGSLLSGPVASSLYFSSESGQLRATWREGESGTELAYSRFNQDVSVTLPNGKTLSLLPSRQDSDGLVASLSTPDGTRTLIQFHPSGPAKSIEVTSDLSRGNHQGSVGLDETGLPWVRDSQDDVSFVRCGRGPMTRIASGTQHSSLQSFFKSSLGQEGYQILGETRDRLLAHVEQSGPGPSLDIQSIIPLPSSAPQTARSGGEVG